jgi:hypothetical protein
VLVCSQDSSVRALAHKWHKSGTKPPDNGREIKNYLFAKALKSQTEFTQVREVGKGRWSERERERERDRHTETHGRGFVLGFKDAIGSWSKTANAHSL